MIRTWAIVARELAKESSAKRRSELHEELNLAVDEQNAFAPIPPVSLPKKTD